MTDSRTSTLTSYDEVPYESHPYPQSHPDRLAMIATLFGMAPTRLEDSRVLELGCSTGGNIFPIAEQFPASTCVGIDASSRQIADGQRLAESLGLRNLRLLHKSILDIGAEFGQFDYIICHGVFSWVPDDVQEKILQICSQNLAPNGVTYISYNTYPGWRMRGMIRDVMTYRARFFEKPEERLGEAQALLDFLTDSVPTKDNAYGILLRDELKLIRGHSKSYLYHEHLEEVNEPRYFFEFMNRAESHGLQYLGEAEFSTMWANNFPPKVEATLKGLSSDLIQTEQYMDFVRNRMFRQTLLCHNDVRLNREIPPDRVARLFVASSAQPENPKADIQSRAPLTFHRPGSTLTTHEPIVKAAMLHLREVWPARVRLDELLVAARNRLASGLVAVNRARAEQELCELGRTIIRCYATSQVDLHFHPSFASIMPGDAPTASPSARRHAADRDRVTNLWHESVHLSELERLLLRQLDGSRNRDALADVLAREVAEGRLLIQEGGREVTDPPRVQAAVRQILSDNLTALGRKGLLRTAPPAR